MSEQKGSEFWDRLTSVGGTRADVENVKEALRGLTSILRIKEATYEKLWEQMAVLARLVYAVDKRIKKFSFTGYTPNFNDGDACEYGKDTRIYVDVLLPDGEVVAIGFEFDRGEENCEGCGSFPCICDSYNGDLIESIKSYRNRDGKSVLEELKTLIPIVKHFIMNTPDDMWQAQGEGEYWFDKDGKVQVLEIDHD